MLIESSGYFGSEHSLKILDMFLQSVHTMSLSSLLTELKLKLLNLSMLLLQETKH
jgi:hypothetical protein